MLRNSPETQAAHAGLTKNSLQFEWFYLQRVTSNCAETFIQLLNTIKTKLLPTIIGGSISDLEGSLLSLPAHKGEMGVHKFESTQIAYSASKEASTKIICAIMGDNEFSLQEQQRHAVNCAMSGWSKIRES